MTFDVSVPEAASAKQTPENMKHFKMTFQNVHKIVNITMVKSHETAKMK